ncbi:recombinase family protein [Streptomyces sp. B8F3]|uniref:recombinase family protein n=1 Tax=unclassified Streptomyces TaxID=2593676 RepID=UPI00325DEFD3
MSALRRRGRIAVPFARRRGRRRLPHRPLHQGAPAGEAAAGADPGRRGPGQPWRPVTPPPAPIGPDTPTADIRIGYARCSTLGQELDSPLDALAAKNIPRDKIFAEKISTRVRVRPACEAALSAAREIKAHAPHCRVILTVYEMKRLGRDAAELTALADHLSAHGLVLEMPAGPLAGMYDPSGHGRLLFAFFAAMAETERETIRESTLEGPDAAGPQGKARRPAAGHHRGHAAHRPAAPGTGREERSSSCSGCG